MHIVNTTLSTKLGGTKPSVPQMFSFGLPQTQTHTKWTKFDVKFIIVANDKGLEQYVRQDELKAGFRKAAQNREDEATRISNILNKNNGMTP